MLFRQGTGIAFIHSADRTTDQTLKTDQITNQTD